MSGPFARALVILAAFALFLILLGWIMPKAEAAEAADDVMRQPVPVVCIVPDFAETGSGWKVHAAVAKWNAAQDTVELVAHRVPGCVVVPVHRYTNRHDDRCAFTWIAYNPDTAPATILNADIYLNDSCRMERPYRLRWNGWVLAHEIGHAMGLPHVGRRPLDVMCYCYRWDELHGLPGSGDVATLAGLYAS